MNWRMEGNAEDFNRTKLVSDDNQPLKISINAIAKRNCRRSNSLLYKHKKTYFKNEDIDGLYVRMAGSIGLKALVHKGCYLRYLCC